MGIILIALVAIPLIGGVVGWILGRQSERDRDIFNVAITGLECLVITLLFPFVKESTIHFIMPKVMGTGMYLKLDMLRYMFVWFSAVIWFLATIYSTQYLIRYENRNRYYLFYMLTLSATVGVFLSENLLNLFTFFEMMSFTSYILVIHDEDHFAHRAGVSYLSMAIAGGLVMLLGVFLIYDYTGTLNISAAHLRMSHLGGVKNVIAGLLITGFGVKAAMFPLHVWLPKAHPAAPSPASAILSGVLIKTGLFGILITVHMLLGSSEKIGYVLMSLAMINMIVGGFFALFQRNIKRILAYSSMSQAGYILFGIGLACLGINIKRLALLGVLAHMFNHAFFKVLLFMGAGVIYMVLHELSINVIKGFGRKKFKLKLVFLIGFLAISGFPGTNGYISKTLLHEAVSVAHHNYHSHFFTLAEVVFFLASAMTTAYMLKIFVTVFLEKNPNYTGQHKDKIKNRAILPMVFIGLIVLGVGIFYKPLLFALQKALYSFYVGPFSIPKIFSTKTLISAFGPIIVGALIYMMFIRRVLYKNQGTKRVYINPTTKWFALEDNLYIPVIQKVYRVGFVFFQILDKWIYYTFHRLQFFIRRMASIKLPKLSFPKKRYFFKKEKVKKRKMKMKIQETKKAEKKLRTKKTEKILKAYEEKRIQSHKNVNLVGDFVKSLYHRASSTAYSLIIVAGVLVLSLIVVLFSNYFH